MRYLLLIFLFIISCGISTGEVESSPYDSGIEKQQCLPDIKSKNDWLAGDGGRSILLPDGRFIHLFGDTLVKPDNKVTFVGNTIGIAECSDDKYNIDFYWREDRAFFDPEREGIRLWPTDGIYHNNKLYVILGQIIEVDYGIGFGYAGPLLAIVDNPLDPPLDWIISYRDIQTEGYIPKSLLVHDGLVYMYASLIVGHYPHPVILLKTALDDLDLFNFEFVSNVVDRASPDFYVHPYGKEWITFHAKPEFMSNEMVIQRANSPEGPWSEGKVVHEFSEMEEPGVICYAVTEHEHLRVDNVAVVTYSCNTLSVLPPLDKLDLYYPKTIKIEL